MNSMKVPVDVLLLAEELSSKSNMKQKISAIRWAYKKHGPKMLVGANIYIHRRGNRLAKPCPHYDGE